MTASRKRGSYDESKKIFHWVFVASCILMFLSIMDALEPVTIFVGLPRFVPLILTLWIIPAAMIVAVFFEVFFFFAMRKKKRQEKPA